MKCNKRICLAGISFFLLLSGCSKKDDPNAAMDSNIVVVGYEKTARDIQVAKVWRKGKTTDLSDGFSPAVATAVAVSGDDVYVAGYQWTSQHQHWVAMYWKNGVSVILSNGEHEALAYSISVDGTDVYVVGYEDSNLGSTAKYWKNGTAINLPNGDSERAAGIVVSNGDLYAAGSVEYVAGSYAKGWKNGIEFFTGPLGSIASSVQISGADYFLAGTSQGFATVWKNGVDTMLDHTTGWSNATSVYVSGPDIFATGTEVVSTRKLAKYWRNGTITELDPKNSTGNSIVVVGSDVFVAGSRQNSPDSPYAATYWKNGTAINLTDGAREASAAAIAILP